MIDKLDLSSPDFVNENLEKIAAIFPNCVTEGPDGKAVDFDLLKQELNHDVIEGTKERYRLEWPGKRQAMVNANLPTTKTLRPVREDSVDFNNTKNLYIEGDNLEVLKILQESYLGKIKMIYIDPPYNTGNDFVYDDNFTRDAKEELIESGQKDEYEQRLVANPDTAGRYHSDWLSMMYPRLKLARNLLKENGIIFISIDDNEVHSLMKICDEIFSEFNFVGLFCRKTKSGGGSAAGTCAVEHDYVLSYAKHNARAKALIEQFSDKYLARYKETDEHGPYFWDTMERSSTATKPYKIKAPDGQLLSGKWFRSEQTFLKDLKTGEVRFLKKENGWSVQFKQRLADGKKMRTIMEDSDLTDKHFRSLNKELEDILGFSLGHPPKPVSLMKTLVYAVLNKDHDDIVLDFFSGSGTTAHGTLALNSADNLNRRFILVQIPEQTSPESDARLAGFENICEIGKKRICRAAAKIKEETGADIDYGFRVYRLDSSNMADVYHNPQNYDQGQLDLLADNVKPDRTAEDLLTQVILAWGLPLSLKIEEEKIAGKQVFKVAGNSLHACFDSGIDEAFAKEIAKEEPLRVVFKDSAFASDTAKVNVRQLLKQLSPNTEMKVI